MTVSDETFDTAVESAYCPVCRDLFTPEHGRLPEHFLDTHEGQPRCDGSGAMAASR